MCYIFKTVEIKCSKLPSTEKDKAAYTKVVSETKIKKTRSKEF